MSAIRLNGQYVLIRDIEKKDFVEFVNLLIVKITQDEAIPRTAANVVASLLAQGKTQSDSLVQAGLQACASLGVKNMWVDGSTANVTEETPTDAAMGLETAFGFASIESGLAVAAAACNAFRRKIQVNEQEVTVIRQPREVMVKVAQTVTAMKNVNEPVFVTAGRFLGSLMKDGKGFDQPETMTALCMLSDLGATLVRIDIAQGQLGFGPFNHANAMASAILQGLDAQKVASVRNSIEQTNEHFRKLSQQQGTPSAPQRQEQRLAVPSVMGTRRRR
jgi:hypothetical protein